MKKRITEFTKYVRKLRIDNDEYLKDMAEKIGTSASYLSAVETGVRTIPSGWEYMIIKAYNLNGEQQEELKKAILYSQPKMKIDITNKSNKDRDLICKFIDRFDYLSTDDKCIIFDIISKYDNLDIRDVI